jgi:type I restriction enzyme M protein
MPGNDNEIERRLWDAADELRTNSKLKSAEYSVPVLGLIFLRYADHKFSLAEKDLANKGSQRRFVNKVGYQREDQGNPGAGLEPESRAVCGRDGASGG